MGFFNAIFTQIVEEHKSSFGFNFDIVETNIVNLSILVGIVFYFGKQFLLNTLGQRQQKVLLAIQEAEQQLTESNLRIVESEKKLEQAHLVIKQIISNAENTAQKIKESILSQGKEEINRFTSAKQTSIENAEIQMRKQIQKKITTLAIDRVTLNLKNKINAEMHKSILENNISKLGGSL
uniref:ATP synthase CFO B subunit subunit I n=1 Tax=Glaucosphaera vacuolata TaxID=38265 RepID=UPI001FCD003A|nr:ATP synthase CFO B subunit subunit I [Glaucosphaera vacuolata]UNJ18664.1 ATP synthase CFO B subunit subunit I [Glaucosphaera vacuolata]